MQLTTVLFGLAATFGLASATPRPAPARSVAGETGCGAYGIYCNSADTFSLCVPTSTGTEYYFFGSVAQGTYCDTDENRIRADNYGNCSPDGQLVCGADGTTFFLCDQGGLISFGPTAGGTECVNGQIVACEGHVQHHYHVFLYHHIQHYHRYYQHLIKHHIVKHHIAKHHLSEHIDQRNHRPIDQFIVEYVKQQCLDQRPNRHDNFDHIFIFIFQHFIPIIFFFNQLFNQFIVKLFFQQFFKLNNQLHHKCYYSHKHQHCYERHNLLKASLVRRLVFGVSKSPF